jgi:hypothetical protein
VVPFQWGSEDDVTTLWFSSTRAEELGSQRRRRQMAVALPNEGGR